MTGPILTYANAAELLGVKHGTLKRWAHEGMPVIRGEGYNSTRVDVAAARAWIDMRRNDPNPLRRLRKVAERWVYFARRLNDGAIKIGFTNDVTRRMDEVDTSVLAKIPGNKTLELALHEAFADARIEGEWFRSTEELEALVLALMDGAP